MDDYSFLKEHILFEVVGTIDDAAWSLFGMLPSDIVVGEN